MKIVEHHDACATFRINGKDTDCFADWITTKHFEEAAETFIDFADTALISTGGSYT